MAQGTDTALQETAAIGEAVPDLESADNGAGARERAVGGTIEHAVPRWLVRLGWALLALQLAYLMGFSVLQYQRFALTVDFTQFHQAWYLIAHGDLVPFDPFLAQNYWQNGGSFFIWPFAILGLPVGSNSLALLWLQDLAIVGTGAVAYSWLLDLTRRPSWPDRFPPAWALGACLVLWVANPWAYWAAAFDVHWEPFGGLFLLLAGRALERRRFRRLPLWVPCVLLCGLPMAAYTAGLGLAGILAGRKWRKAGLAVLATSVLWVGVVGSVALKGSKGSADFFSFYGYLATGTKYTSGHSSFGQVVIGVASHPGRVLAQYWSRRLNIWANLAPSGLVGFLTPWGFGVAFVSLLANGLASYGLFTIPGFQSFPLYGFVVVGTAYFLAYLSRRLSWGPRAAKVLCGLLSLNALFWCLVWVPQAWPQWIRVSAPAAHVLARAEADIPPNAEVVVSQGVAGRFSSRKAIEIIFGSTLKAPIVAKPVYFVVAPYQGVETAPSSAQLGMLWYIAGTLHARLIAAGAGIWAFRWDPPPSVHTVDLTSSPTVPGWALPTTEGKAVLAGRVADWHMASGPTPGYVVDQAYWREPPGRYVASVALASTGPATIEVRNADSGELLASRHLTGTDGLIDVFVDARNPREVAPAVFGGRGPFQIEPIPPPPGNQLEVRVSAGPRSEVSVYSVEMVPQHAAHAASRLGQ